LAEVAGSAKRNERSADVGREGIITIVANYWWPTRNYRNKRLYTGLCTGLGEVEPLPTDIDIEIVSYTRMRGGVLRISADYGYALPRQRQSAVEISGSSGLYRTQQEGRDLGMTSRTPSSLSSRMPESAHTIYSRPATE
jgi:hypothetical protein